MSLYIFARNRVLMNRFCCFSFLNLLVCTLGSIDPIGWSMSEFGLTCSDHCFLDGFHLSVRLVRPVRPC